MKIERPFRKTRALELATSSIFKPYHFFCYHVSPPPFIQRFFESSASLSPTSTLCAVKIHAALIRSLIWPPSSRSGPGQLPGAPPPNVPFNSPETTSNFHVGLEICLSGSLPRPSLTTISLVISGLLRLTRPKCPYG